MKGISPEEYQLYLKNKLSDERKKEIDQFLEEHPLFRESLEGFNYFPEEPALDKILDGLNEKIDSKLATYSPPEKKTRQLRTRRWWLSAAAILLLIASFIWVYQISSSPSPTDLYAEYFEAFPNTLENVERGEAEVNGMANYERGNYTSAIPFLKNRIEKDPQDLPARFYLAQCHLALDNTTAAFPELEQVSRSSNRTWRNLANWYIALAWLKEEQPGKATPLLQMVISNDGDFSGEAKELIEKLE